MLNHIILGLVQGITEFLPVSSSGHLIIAREVLNIPLAGSLATDVFLHVATLLATIIYFAGDIRRIIIDLFSNGFSTRSKRLVFAIVLGSIPAAIAGFTWGDKIESTFRDPHLVAYALIAGSIIFFFADRFSKNISDTGGITGIKGFLIGVYQAVALIPGVSRSGITISGGLFSKLSREEAIKFAFLLSIPTIAGAALKTFLSIDNLSGSFINAESLVAFAVAFVSGLIAVRFVVRYLENHSFNAFIIYRLALALLILAFVN